MARGPVLNRARARPQGGFTLIELLITVVVTMVGLIGLFGVFSVTSRGNTEARESGEALSVLQSAADDLKSMTVAELEQKYTPLSLATPAWGPVAYHEPPVDPRTGIHVGMTGTVFVREVEAKRIDDDLIWVRVSVRWATEGATLGVSLANDRELGLEMLRSRTEGPL